MRRVVKGRIVLSQIENFGETNLSKGFVTLLTPDNEYVRIDIGSYTSFETLDENEAVVAKLETLGGPDEWIALEVLRDKAIRGNVGDQD